MMYPPGTTPPREAKRYIFRYSDRLGTRPPRGGDDRLPRATDRTRSQLQLDGGEGNLLREEGSLMHPGACDVHPHSAGAGASGQS